MLTILLRIEIDTSYLSHLKYFNQIMYGVSGITFQLNKAVR